MSQHERGDSVANPTRAMSPEQASTARPQATVANRRTPYWQMTLLAMLVGLLGWLTYRHHESWWSVWTEGRLLRGEVNGLSLAQAQGQPRRAGAFDLSQVTVPANEIFAGGPPKDGIPALTNPTLIPAGEARYLAPQDRVIGVMIADDSRAYPLKILNYHEIVNDRVADIPIAVTYCPLCDSAAVFDRRTPLGEREFGVSGLLHNSNVLMYDRGGQPESLWSQVKAEGISGPAANKPLTALPVELTTWQDWQTRYPATTVLSPRTGHRRDYRRDPYASYFDQPRLMFPALPVSDRLPTKARVLGVWLGNTARAYPESAFSRQRTRAEEEIDGKRIVVEFDPDTRALRVVEADDGASWMYSLWFAWYAFRPQTSVFE